MIDHNLGLTLTEVTSIVDNFPEAGRMKIKACARDIQKVLDQYGAFYGHWALILVESERPESIGLFPKGENRD